jgi:Protein of unknown function (DUF3592)
VSDRPDGVTGNPTGATIAGLVLFLAGLAIGIGTLEADRKDRQLREGTLTAEGTVVAQLKQQTPKGQAYAPLVAFATVSGDRISFTGPAADPNVYWLGAKVPVRYAPGNPSGARIDRTTSGRLRNLIAGTASVLLIGLGGYVAWYARSLQRS